LSITLCIPANCTNGLRNDAGFAEGRNIAMEYRWAGGRLIAYERSALECHKCMGCSYPPHVGCFLLPHELPNLGLVELAGLNFWEGKRRKRPPSTANVSSDRFGPAILSGRIKDGGAVPFGRRSCPAERQELGPQISCRSPGRHQGRSCLMVVIERSLDSAQIYSGPRA
jgi:hypothetical protein